MTAGTVGTSEQAQHDAVIGQKSIAHVTLAKETSAPPPPAAPVRRGVLFPNHYAWYILAATLDVIVTHQILHHFNGSEVNKLARLLIERFGLPGMIGLKYSSIIVVLAVCEVVGRRSLRAGRRLAVAAVIMSALPVGIGLLQVWAWTHLVPEESPAATEPFRRPAAASEPGGGEPAEALPGIAAE